jgi:hypothetical protein
MPRVRFEPTIPVFERAKTFHALDRAATAIGTLHTVVDCIMWNKMILNYEFGSYGKEHTFYNLKILKPLNKKD